ncbi:LOW QUALITY PROTEIN: uncharacterized protein EMH_0043930 [Eimeria mitis]|uniref:Uncharacterized protein n=1 Tax=Eimeria mitis TaxID=44415 RepID=U6JZ39_9EIME|nr:LOW QUALITY PROTEIN: uncharacterized protein EMH_0043930 [Eimeria mitis]CDJ28783.1 hypothetical protein, conserved [Eimeria mitis]
MGPPICLGGLWAPLLQLRFRLLLLVLLLLLLSCLLGSCDARSRQQQNVGSNSRGSSKTEETEAEVAQEDYADYTVGTEWFKGGGLDRRGNRAGARGRGAPGAFRLSRLGFASLMAMFAAVLLARKALQEEKRLSREEATLEAELDQQDDTAATRNRFKQAEERELFSQQVIREEMQLMEQEQEHEEHQMQQLQRRIKIARDRYAQALIPPDAKMTQQLREAKARLIEARKDHSEAQISLEAYYKVHDMPPAELKNLLNTLQEELRETERAAARLDLCLSSSREAKTVQDMVQAKQVMLHALEKEIEIVEDEVLEGEEGNKAVKELQEEEEAAIAEDMLELKEIQEELEEHKTKTIEAIQQRLKDKEKINEEIEQAEEMLQQGVEELVKLENSPQVFKRKELLLKKAAELQQQFTKELRELLLGGQEPAEGEEDVWGVEEKDPTASFTPEEAELLETKQLLRRLRKEKEEIELELETLSDLKERAQVARAIHNLFIAQADAAVDDLVDLKEDPAQDEELSEFAQFLAEKMRERQMASSAAATGADGAAAAADGGGDEAATAAAGQGEENVKKEEEKENEEKKEEEKEGEKDGDKKEDDKEGEKAETAATAEGGEEKAEKKEEEEKKEGEEKKEDEKKEDEKNGEEKDGGKEKDENVEEKKEVGEGEKKEEKKEEGEGDKEKDEKVEEKKEMGEGEKKEEKKEEEEKKDEEKGDGEGGKEEDDKDEGVRLAEEAIELARHRLKDKGERRETLKLQLQQVEAKIAKAEALLQERQQRVNMLKSVVADQITNAAGYGIAVADITAQRLRQLERALKRLTKHADRVHKDAERAIEIHPEEADQHLLLVQIADDGILVGIKRLFDELLRMRLAERTATDNIWMARQKEALLAPGVFRELLQHAVADGPTCSEQQQLQAALKQRVQEETQNLEKDLELSESFVQGVHKWLKEIKKAEKVDFLNIRSQHMEALTSLLREQANQAFCQQRLKTLRKQTDSVIEEAVQDLFTAALRERQQRETFYGDTKQTADAIHFAHKSAITEEARRLRGLDRMAKDLARKYAPLEAAALLPPLGKRKEKKYTYFPEGSAKRFAGEPVTERPEPTSTTKLMGGYVGESHEGVLQLSRKGKGSKKQAPNKP